MFLINLASLRPVASGKNQENDNKFGADTRGVDRSFGNEDRREHEFISCLRSVRIWLENEIMFQKALCGSIARYQ